VSEPPPGSAAAARADPAPGQLRKRYERQLAERHFCPDPAQLQVVQRLEDLRSRLLAAAPAHSAHVARWLRALTGRAEPTPVKGLYLWGAVGRGKTWLLDLFFASLPKAFARRCHFHRFMQEVHLRLAHLQHEQSPLEHIARTIARDTRVLGLDELYVADIADAMILGALFDGLLRHGVTLIATSNVAPRELYRDGLQRQRFLPAIAALEQHLEVLQVGGTTDYRLRRLTQASIYLPSGQADTAAHLDALFSHLADHATQHGGTIEIAGRPIAVIRAGTSAVWFDFAALCVGPRSQEDYIEIAREYSSVIVSDVPVLDSLHEDEARRFIALVDEFYDRNVNLIVSAAAAPAALYRGERLSELFARTASRLTEMQSVQYLAREHRP
jgi:cell division protein ZapE